MIYIFFVIFIGKIIFSYIIAEVFKSIDHRIATVDEQCFDMETEIEDVLFRLSRSKQSHSTKSSVKNKING